MSPLRAFECSLPLALLPVALALGCAGESPGLTLADASADPSSDIVDAPAAVADAPPGVADAPYDATAMDGPPQTDACVPTVAAAQENNDALCANGVDDDCNGYADCRDFRCSRYTPAVTVCRVDGGTAPADAPSVVYVPPARMDAPGGAIGPTGGSVARMRFGVFGDVRPPSANDTAHYPAAIVAAVMDGIAASGAQFAVANGDYMFALNAEASAAQVGMLLAAESRFGGHVFHSLGNHECTGASASNCPLGNETAQMRAFRANLAPSYPAPYFDWVVTTALGDAHFIATAPNAWSPTQQAWLDRALARPARYTIVIAHEPPGNREAPGSVAIESAVAARPGGVTLRLYGHTHEYRHLAGNAIIAGNAGAPLASASGEYGFVVVDQRADGDLVVTAYTIGHPPMVADSFVLTPGGALTR
jgi:hypothetical protein